jgi:two-component system cell cycle sensor histidine kinase/response regulator CckA
MHSTHSGRSRTVARTALLVDDEPGVRTYVSNVLQCDGFHVVEAADGIDALSRIRELRGAVDILVTDIRMPGMTGTELVGAVRTEFPEIPVVFISGEQLRDTLHNPDGRVLFLRKPFGPKAMLEAVRSLFVDPVSTRGSGA